MYFTDIFIKRPVLASVVSLLLALVGVITYTKLDLRQFPEISPTVVTVTTAYPGADANLMEGFVTTPLENALAGTDGLDYIMSKSQHGQSRITMHFRLGYDIHQAVTDVGDQVASVRSQLPDQIRNPTIEKQDPNANTTMYLVFQSQKRPTEAIYDYLERRVQTKLETLKGVGRARIFGDRRYAMRIWLNPERMAAHNITARDVSQMLKANNARTPTGRIESHLTEYEVRAQTDLHKAEQFNNLAIKHENGHTVKLRDIGTANLGSANDRVSVNFNGRKGVVIGITPKSGANPLAISQRVKSKLTDIKANMPGDLNARLLWDDSKFIKASIHEVYKTIIEAVIFVLIVVFLFLGSMRTLSIPAVTIPLSLVGGFALMYWMGYSLNTLTLLAFVLAIGMVVDDAIVVAENIHRHIDEGEGSYQGAITGAREIQFAVISITLTLAAVYAPIGFMTGLTGQLFQEFAFTLAGVVIISGIIALTLSPMMCSKILKPSQKTGRIAGSINRYSHKMINGYRGLLSKIMNWRMTLVIIFATTLIAGAALYRLIPDQLAPKEDQGLIFSVAEGPAQANLNYTEKYTQQLAELFQQTPEVTSYGVINGMPNGTHSAMAFSMLKPWSQRQRSLNEVLATLRPKAAQIPGLNIFPLNPYTLPGIGENQPIQFIMQSTGSYQKLAEVAEQMKQAAKRQPGLVNVDITLKVDKPVIDVDINRAMAADLNIPMQSIGETLNIALGDFDVGRFARQGRSYYVIPQLSAPYRHNPRSIENLYLRGNDQQLVQLGTVANAEQHIEPRFLPHFQQLRSARLKATIIPGFSLGNALKTLKKQFKQFKTDNMDFNYAGISRHFVKAQGTLYQTLIFAVLFIYLVLAAQFESFLDPLLILLTVPLSTTGGLALLAIGGGTLNIYTQIGLVTLVGLISKHGILLVEFANQLQNQGYNKQQAALEAAALRLRPILMTTASMVLSATPLVLATGAGAYSRYQMGLVIIGGMVFGTLLTLFVIPAFYSYIGSRKPQLT